MPQRTPIGVLQKVKRPRKKIYPQVMRTVAHLRQAPKHSPQRKSAAKLLRYYQLKANRSSARMAAKVSKATAAAQGPKAIAY